jgi:hypothetical protein
VPLTASLSVGLEALLPKAMVPLVKPEVVGVKTLLTLTLWPGAKTVGNDGQIHQQGFRFAHADCTEAQGAGRARKLFGSCLGVHGQEAKQADECEFGYEVD